MDAMLAPSQLLLWILLLCLLAWTITFIWLAFRRIPDTSEMIVEESPVQAMQAVHTPLANLAAIDPITPAVEVASSSEMNLVNATID
jgi:hypothetical protein